MITLDEAIDKVSGNLSIVLNKLETIEREKKLNAKDMVEVQQIKDRIVDISNIILSLNDNKDIVNKNYIAHEIKVAQKFCKKSMEVLNAIR